MKAQYKAGDLVRVPGGSVSYLCYSHHLPQGSVCEVTGTRPNGDLHLKHPEFGHPQIVHYTMVKPAKQAMAEREALRLLDVGNIPKARNKSPVANRMRKHIQAYASRRGWALHSHWSFESCK